VLPEVGGASLTGVAGGGVVVTGVVGAGVDGNGVVAGLVGVELTGGVAGDGVVVVEGSSVDSEVTCVTGVLGSAELTTPVPTVVAAAGAFGSVAGSDTGLVVAALGLTGLPRCLRCAAPTDEALVALAVLSG
jgi:hypothetical protein